MEMLGHVWCSDSNGSLPAWQGIPIGQSIDERRGLPRFPPDTDLKRTFTAFRTAVEDQARRCMLVFLEALTSLPHSAALFSQRLPTGVSGRQQSSLEQFFALHCSSGH